MYHFLSVSFSFFSQNEWLDSRGVVSPNSLAVWSLGGCIKIKILQVEKPWVPRSDCRQGFCHQESLSVLPWNFHSWFFLGACNTKVKSNFMSHGNLSIHQLQGFKQWLKWINLQSLFHSHLFSNQLHRKTGGRAEAENKGEDSTADNLVFAHTVQHVWQPVSYTRNCTELHQENWNLCDGSKIQQT